MAQTPRGNARGGCSPAVTKFSRWKGGSSGQWWLFCSSTSREGEEASEEGSFKKEIDLGLQGAVLTKVR
jgi:hypothetical protein